MDNRCPKCGEKLKIFYLKPICPKCGCNIMYYNMDARLEEDSVKAEKEWSNLEKLLPKFLKGKNKKEDK